MSWSFDLSVFDDFVKAVDQAGANIDLLSEDGQVPIRDVKEFIKETSNLSEQLGAIVKSSRSASPTVWWVSPSLTGWTSWERR